MDFWGGTIFAVLFALVVAKGVDWAGLSHWLVLLAVGVVTTILVWKAAVAVFHHTIGSALVYLLGWYLVMRLPDDDEEEG